MRLLHFNELGRPVLTDFRGKTIPPYAILSHRWSEPEISFADISNGTYEEKEEAYLKLQFCAEQAAQDELQYFWIDTCCIDIWNSDERSRSINSMFQWYKDASQCYVFLSDVSVSTKTAPIQRSDWEPSFRQSKWFTRGWTLQELIAPVSVKFFSYEGEYIGDKALLDQLIHDITSIPLNALRNCALDQFTVAERKRWAENRVTTEEEDTVYCLLGIMGVSMPTSYGEGHESASRRLQAEVEEAGSAPSVIPFSRNKHFVGREAQLAEVEAKLFSNEQSTTTLAILGSGGTGKSQLALEVAHRTKRNYTNCAVFWIDASEKESIYLSFVRVAQKLRIPGGDQADTSQVVKLCVAELSKRQCLLIFDNADTLPRSGSSSTAEATYLANYLPQSTSCSVIFTTTNSEIAEAIAPQNIIELQELLPETAQRMLQNRLSRQLSSTEQQDLSVLLKDLSYLPLAVAQAAACMNASDLTVQAYQRRLKPKKTPLKSSSNLNRDTLLDSSVEDTVLATVFVAINQIHPRNALATMYLFLAACVERRDISLDLLPAASAQGREDAIKILNRYALITRRPAESALDIHRLVHDAIRKRLQENGHFRQGTKRTIIQLLQVYPSSDHSNRSKWRRLLPHALCALSHSRTGDDDREEKEKEEDGKEENKRIELAQKCARALYNDGRYREAEELEVQVLEAKKRALGEEHPDTLSSKANLAMAYERQGRWKEAEELVGQVLEAKKRVLGEEHRQTLRSMSNLALTYISQGRWKEAEELSVQVIETRKRVFGKEHLDTLTDIANLASTYMHQGRWMEAEELYVQVIETRKRATGEEHPDTLSNMHNLAWTFRSLGRYNEALVLMERCYQLRQRILGDRHPHTQSSLKARNRWRDAKEERDNEEEDGEDKRTTM